MTGKPTKVAFVGSREFKSRSVVEVTVASFIKKLGIENFILVSGGARGVDKWSEDAARHLGVPDEQIIVFKPNWYPNGVYDPSQGFERNTLIIEAAELIVACWDLLSKGTMDSVFKAKDLGKKVIVLDYEGKKVDESRWVRPRQLRGRVGQTSI